jgi:mono/diheme cytochrome c family protein
MIGHGAARMAALLGALALAGMAAPPARAWAPNRAVVAVAVVQDTARKARPAPTRRKKAPATGKTAGRRTTGGTTRATTTTAATPPTRDTSTTTPAVQPPASGATVAGAQGAGNAQSGDLLVSQAEYNGWKTFAVNCTRCHGEDAVGSVLAPSLVKSLRGAVTHDVFVQTVMHGRPEKGMPTWAPVLRPEQVEELYAYLKARSDGRLLPGRPHVKTGN